METQLEDATQKATYITDSDRYESLDYVNPDDVTDVQFHVRCTRCNTHNNPSYTLPVTSGTWVNCSNCDNRIYISPSKDDETVYYHATDIQSLVDILNKKRRVAIAQTVASDTYKSRIKTLHSVFFVSAIITMISTAVASLSIMYLLFNVATIGTGQLVLTLTLLLSAIFIPLFIFIEIDDIGAKILPELDMLNPPSPKSVIQNISIFQNGFTHLETDKDNPTRDYIHD